MRYVVPVLKGAIIIGLLLLSAKLGPIVFFIVAPFVALMLFESLLRKVWRRNAGYRLDANERARKRRWQSKIDSEATAKYDPGYWDRERAYNEQVGFAATNGQAQPDPKPPVAQHDLSARLAQLDAAKAAGQLSDAEYTKKRNDIIASI